MNLRQLRYFCTVVECGFNMSSAAAALHTSQPSVSRHIQALEDELEIALFKRTAKRINGLTSSGSEALQLARRMLHDADNLRQLGKDFSAQDAGRLTITTSHTHARYVLPKVIEQFTRDYPKVHVSIRQGHPLQITQWVTTGEADLSISSDPIHVLPELALLPCSEHHVVILTRSSDPLLRKRTVTIADLANKPLITYNSDFSIHAKVMNAFARKKVDPNIVLSATDVDVMKTYVKNGLGVAIVTGLGYDPEEDRGLKAIDAKHLFGSTRIYLGVRKFTYLRKFAYHFIQLFSPSLKREIVEGAIRGERQTPRA